MFMCWLIFLFFFLCKWVCSTQAINLTVIRTGWDVVFLFCRIFLRSFPFH